MKKYIKIIFDITCVGLLICILFFTISSFKGRSNPKYVSGVGTFKLMHVITSSMNPSINIGDIIITKSVDAAKLKKGDIITFRTSSNVLVTHRIKSINEDGSFVTKGDANNLEDIDLNADKDNIIGKYVFKIPKGYHAIPLLLLLVLLLQSNAKWIMSAIMNNMNMSF